MGCKMSLFRSTKSTEAALELLLGRMRSRGKDGTPRVVTKETKGGGASAEAEGLHGQGISLRHLHEDVLASEAMDTDGRDRMKGSRTLFSIGKSKGAVVQGGVEERVARMVSMVVERTIPRLSMGLWACLLWGHPRSCCFWGCFLAHFG